MLAKPLHVITIATDENNWLQNWRESANKWGYTYTILGKGQEWNGFSLWTKLILEFLQTRSFDEIILIVDAYDLLFTGPPREVLEKYRKFNTSIVVGGEDMCMLNCHEHSSDVNNEKYKWVNSGCVIGRVDALADMFTYVMKISPEDDQVGIAKYLDLKPSAMTIDGNQTIVANIRRSGELKCIEGGRFQHQETHTVPAMVHMPFMYADFGMRSEMVRHHALDNYKPPPSFTYGRGLILHLYKHLTTNKVYTPIRIALWLTLTFVLFLFAYVFIFR